MPSTYTTRLRFELQGTGENLNNWGARLNTALTRIDAAIAGRAAITLAGPTAYTLSVSNVADDEARNAFLDLSGVGGCSLIIPSVSKVYTIRNGSNGAVTVTTGAGTTVVLSVGDTMMVACDGTNVRTFSIAGFDLKTYIDAAILSTTGSLPATTGNEGRSLVVVGGAWTPKLLTTADLADKNTAITGLAVAFATAL
jgi:hypothetical protein